ncbi:hypothetical protein BJV77DRAFT_452199 [Russula vinacea]|nr:hypothetical protein BJV77DRAFT_452199 [Russula vinacea]
MGLPNPPPHFPLCVNLCHFGGVLYVPSGPRPLWMFPVSDHMSFPYTSACASQLQKYMCHKHSSEVYSWSMAVQPPSHPSSLPRCRPRSPHSRGCQRWSKETNLTVR